MAGHLGEGAGEEITETCERLFGGFGVVKRGGGGGSEESDDTSSGD